MNVDKLKSIDYWLDKVAFWESQLVKASKLDESIGIKYEVIRNAEEGLENARDMLIFFQSQNNIGRPSIGVTKKVSLTLPQDDWDLLDGIKQDTGKSTSAVLREILSSYLVTYDSDKNINLSKDFIL